MLLSVSSVWEGSWARYEKSRIPLMVQSSLSEEQLSGRGKPIMRPRRTLHISACSFPDIHVKPEIPFEKCWML